MATYHSSIGLALKELLETNERVILLGEDICDPYGGAFKVTKGLSGQYPDRVLNTPISEAAITGISSGLALSGFRPIVEIMFADFLGLVADQVINHAAKFSWMYNEKVTVPLVIRAPAGGYRGYGPTHSQCFETLFLGVPNLKIVAPSHLHNPGKLLIESVQNDEPVLFVENKSCYSKKICTPLAARECIYTVLGEGLNRTVRLAYGEGDPDVTLTCYGGALLLAEEAALRLSREELVVHVYAPACISPFDISPMEMSLKTSKCLVTLEETIAEGGWGSEVISTAFERGLFRGPASRIGARPLPIGSSKQLENEILPAVDDVVNGVVDTLFKQ